MRVDQFFTESLLFGFLFTLTRISAVVAFLPLPGMKATPANVRILLSMAMTVALWPVWSPHQTQTRFTISGLAAGIAVEAAYGLAIGLVVGIGVEVFQAAAQFISVQAGFAYASTIDPSTGADSPVLVTLSQLVAALLFVTSGADRSLYRVLCEAIVLHPPGSMIFHTARAGNEILHFASLIFSAGFRIAAPLTVLLLLADLLLAVFGRLQPQLQLTSLTFPVKLAASAILLGFLIRFYPRFFESVFAQGFHLMQGLASGGAAR